MDAEDITPDVLQALAERLSVRIHFNAYEWFERSNSLTVEILLDGQTITSDSTSINPAMD